MKYYKCYTLTVVIFLFLAATTIAKESKKPSMTFFVTSESHSGDLGGIAGADDICDRLAKNVSEDNKTWRAYLSTHGTATTTAINARDRIGNGPWHNANGRMIAANLADLHGDIERDRNLIYRDTALTEKGELVNGRIRPEGENNEHDILTGSDSHGRAFSVGASVFQNQTCDNWTNGKDNGAAMLGHHDRKGRFSTSWNSSHSSSGCSLKAFKKTGGAGYFYCFALNN